MSIINPRVKIEPATDCDLASLGHLMRSYCEFYEVKSPGAEQLRQMALEIINADDRDGMLFVARGIGSTLLAFATVSWKWSTLRGGRVAILEDLYVVPTRRGQRIAGMLIDHISNRVKELGAPALLWMTAPDNEQAHAAYARTGATPSNWFEYELELDEASSINTASTG